MALRGKTLAPRSDIVRKFCSVVALHGTSMLCAT